MRFVRSIAIPIMIAMSPGLTLAADPVTTAAELSAAVRDGKDRSRNSCPMSPWRKLPACDAVIYRKLEAYATYFSNGAYVSGLGRFRSRLQAMDSVPFWKGP